MALGHAQWRKSSRSTEGEACIEVAHTASLTVGIRDSKNPEGGRLTFSTTALHHLTRTITS